MVRASFRTVRAGNVEKIFFAKVEAWVVYAIVAVMALLAILYGWTVMKAANGPRKLGAVQAAALTTARIPDTVKAIIRNKDPREADRTSRFGDKAGWIPSSDGDATGLDGYLLLSRFSGDDGRAVVELVDLADFTTRHRWLTDADSLLADAPRESTVTDFSGWNTWRFRAIHPLLLPDGGLIMKDHETPLFRLDACGGTVWMEATDLYHHSTNLDAEGHLWVPSRIEPSDQSPSPDFNDDGATELTLDGERLGVISVTETMIENGLMPIILTAGGFDDDPIHLNDIEPVLADGPYWKKGDLFLSLRHKSLVMLVRPSTRKILWYRIGPWMAQHDVDILDDHRISVFDNAAYDRGAGSYIDGNNQVMIYDFATDTVTSPWKAAMEKMDMLTASEGLVDFTLSGHLVMEESNSGRIVILDRAGGLVGEYYNRTEDGRRFKMAWSRYVPKAQGDAALTALATSSCSR
jgi:hypothetical protein